MKNPEPFPHIHIETEIQDAHLARRERSTSFRRHLLMLLTGQVLLRRKRVPGKTRRMLWYYNWNALGDSIMDLSQRFMIPEQIELDLLWPNELAALFEGDARFHRIYRSIDEIDGPYDFVLIQDLATRSIRFKLKHFFSTPFAYVHEHLMAERFSRMEFSAQHLAGLFDLALAPAQPPSLPFPKLPAAPGKIVVALGGRDPRRTYENWAEVLKLVLDEWPDEHTFPRFLLTGRGESAKRALAQIPEDFLTAHCSTLIDTDDPRYLVTEIAGCSAFLGADGGLMHIAAACDKPGLALFCAIKPEWRLHPDSQLASIYDDSDLNRIAAKRIARELITQLFPVQTA